MELSLKRFFLFKKEYFCVLLQKTTSVLGRVFFFLSYHGTLYVIVLSSIYCGGPFGTLGGGSVLKSIYIYVNIYIYICLCIFVGP